MTYDKFIRLIQEVSMDKYYESKQGGFVLGKILETDPLDILLLDGTDMHLNSNDVYFSKLFSRGTNEGMVAVMNLSEPLESSRTFGKNSHSHQVPLLEGLCSLRFPIQAEELVLMIRMPDHLKHIVLVPVTNDDHL